MGGLKKALPVTYWTFLIGALAIAGFPLLSGFFSKDEILFRTFTGGHRILWTVGAVTSLLTAIYMFRLVFLAFHGPSPAASAAQAARHGHGGHLHDAPPSMAIPLIVLAIGSVVAGYVGVPHALGGSNRIETFLEPSFTVEATAETEGHGAEGDAAHAVPAEGSTELALMGASSAIAVVGIGLAVFYFLKRRDRAAKMAASFPGVYRLLLNKYYVDEVYDTAIVQPIKRTSTVALWRGVDAVVIDGAVNGTGAAVRFGSGVLRRLQSGSIRTYAVSLLFGVVAILGYYLW
jgi:NADH-quinone oxidoreductase subunit L